MKTNRFSFIPIILTILVFVVSAWLVIPNLTKQNIEGEGVSSAYGSDAVKGEVTQILEEGMVTLGEVEQPYQIVLVKVLEGEYTGELLPIEYGKRQVLASPIQMKIGETVYISVAVRPDTGAVRGFFMDFDRARSILMLFLIFLFFSILISGWKGVRSVIGIGFSMTFIVFYIIPNILDCQDPVITSIIGAFIFLSISQFLVYGWNLKTHAAVMGILLSLVITGLLSSFFVDFTRLTGFGDENILFLSQMVQNLNLRGLLLAGMLIGSLGVLDDLVISQASAVFELRAANNQLGFKFLYKRAMNIGKDHVAATVNTLVLAYAGASLPMLLLFTISNQDPTVLVNLSFIAEEVVRTLVGSIGLFLSVPLTTALAALIATQHHKYPWITKYFGPDNQWDEVHFH